MDKFSHIQTADSLKEEETQIVESSFEQLDTWTAKCMENCLTDIDYPCNNDNSLDKFYHWFVKNKIGKLVINNAGDPFEPCSCSHSTAQFEREVLEYFAPKYGFDKGDYK